MKFSIIIPCYNEAKSLPLLVDRCRNLAKQTSEDIEFIFVDNGSTDLTPVIMKKLLFTSYGCRSIRVNSNQGYGHGILAGLAEAKGDVLGWTHADLQTDPSDILSAIEIFKKHRVKIFVKGRRYGRPISDLFFTVAMSIFETIYLSRRLWDINAQPTLFNRNFYESWVDAPHDFALDLFAYAEARTMRLPIYRFPVKFGERVYGMSNWNVNWPSKIKFIIRTLEFSRKLKRRSQG